MVFLSKVFKSKDASKVGSKHKVQHVDISRGEVMPPAKPRFVSTWSSKEIDPTEVEELIHVCTLILKSRGMLHSKHPNFALANCIAQPRLSTLHFCSYHSDRKPTLFLQGLLSPISSKQTAKEAETMPARVFAESLFLLILPYVKSTVYAFEHG
jgi:hypothetical protein